METKDTQIEGLAYIAARYGMAWQAQEGNLKALLADPAILAHIPAVKALQEENERLSGLSKEYFGKLNGWQEAYIKAERTLLLAGFTDEGGELWKPPLGPSPSPLLGRIATLEAQLAEVREREDILCGLLGEAKAQLSGGEAVAIVETVNGSPKSFVYTGAIFDLRDGSHKLYTAAPAIKQQVAEGWRIESRVIYNEDKTQQIICQMEHNDEIVVDDELTARVFAMLTSSTQPVSANQPDSGKDDPFLLKSMGVGAEGDE